jgi:hypothetical protein
MNLKIKTSRRNLSNSRKVFQRRRRVHDPLLVFNMSIFNFGGGWQEIFSAIKARENVG